MATTRTLDRKYPAVARTQTTTRSADNTLNIQIPRYTPSVYTQIPRCNGHRLYTIRHTGPALEPTVQTKSDPAA